MTDATRTKVGLIGCGNISAIYLKSDQTFDNLQVVGCADIDLARAQARAAEYGIQAYTVNDLLADPAIEIVVNLTVPAAHAEVATRALNAGKATYSEKPFALDRTAGRRLLDLAQTKGLAIGCAPDTFLGGGLQTCRKLVDDGVIGEPVAATAHMISHGHESWHPNPEFYYKAGGGPLFDMGPYYLTALVAIIGPVRAVAGMTRITFPERVVTSQPNAGQRITVEVPTHVTGLLEFANGAIGTLIQTFDVWGANLPRLEIYGTEGSLSLPDPNTFGGPVRVRRKGKADWEEVPLSHIYTENSRGLGVADLAAAMRSGRPPRASGELAYHVLDIMQAIHEAAAGRTTVELTSSCARPAMVPVGLQPGAVEL
jgi:predicted dehydrogenase